MSHAEPVIASAVPIRCVLLLKRSPWYMKDEADWEPRSHYRPPATRAGRVDSLAGLLH